VRQRMQSSTKNRPAPQLDLFDLATPVSQAAPQASRPPSLSPSLARSADRLTPSPALAAQYDAKGMDRGPRHSVEPRLRSKTGCRVRVVGLDDMPVYSELDHEMVERSLETLPVDRIWFTYAAIQTCFGISRATIARRMKDGLIPGIRFEGAQVLEDGRVRRFNRVQLRWLLLAVRNPRPPQSPHRAIRPSAEAMAS
jgi:hypothetical protein